MRAPAPRRVLVVFAHPALEHSRVNRVLTATAAGVTGVTVHDLYERYPDFQIDVAREQALLLAHDAVVFQHPFYWYSVPALLKEWFDLVLEYGFAYGHGTGEGHDGRALADKLWLHAVTTGGREEAYTHGGRNRFTMRELMAPFDQSAHLCGMRYLPPFVVHGALRLDRPEDVAPAALRYRLLLEALRDDTLDLAAAASAERLNDVVGEEIA